MAKAGNIITKILVEVSRLILGATFVFSGFVKSVDPYGTCYKIEDYMSAFGCSSLSFLAMPISFLLCGLEFIMGAFMLLGIYRKWNSRLMLLTMCFMTPLTLYLAIANPVEDCGCFGDALKISNWETFYKNVVLLACAIFVCIKREKISNFFTGKTYWLAFLYIIIFICLFMFRNYYLDPLFDFRPYKVGANLPKLMDVEVGKGRVEESILVYEQNGIEKEFTEENYPWQDSTWTFVRMDTKVINPGIEPIIKDFTINHLSFNREMNVLIEEQDITQQVLNDSNYTFLMISPSLANMNLNHLSNFEDVYNYSIDNHYEFYCLTASSPEEIMQWSKSNVIDFEFCLTDERTLKTIIRTNPGLLLLKNGVIINKWADLTAPAEEDLTAPLQNLPYSELIDIKETDNRNLFYVILIFILPLVLLKGLDLLFFRKKDPKLLARKEQKEN